MSAASEDALASSVGLYVGSSTEWDACRSSALSRALEENGLSVEEKNINEPFEIRLTRIYAKASSGTLHTLLLTDYHSRGA